tara:strand:- start:1964 stop:2224 length:261 start_codon:yes stop_codon:yes gene_type:complete
MNRGRPKGSKNSKETKFIGLKLPGKLSSLLAKDAEAHFRSKTGHILWILTRYCMEFTEEGLRVYEDQDSGKMTDYMGNPVNVKKEG